MGALGSNDINTKPISNKLHNNNNKRNIMQVSVVHLDDGSQKGNIFSLYHSWLGEWG
jgi:hypothetical protein